MVVGGISLARKQPVSIVSRAELPAARDAREERATGSVSLFSVFLGLLYLSALAAVIAVFWEGREFYATPLAERAHHAGYWRFKPGGSAGLPLGIVGSAMMLLLLL